MGETMGALRRLIEEHRSNGFTFEGCMIAAAVVTGIVVGVSSLLPT
jgi:hypothetical protein